MKNGDDPLDLDGDGKFTYADMAILDEEETQRTPVATKTADAV